MRTSPTYYVVVILFAFAALMLNLATCRTRTVYSNTWVVQVDGGLTGAERIAAEKDLVLLGQVIEQSRLSCRDCCRYLILTGSSIAREFNLSTDLGFRGLVCSLARRETFTFCLCR